MSGKNEEKDQILETSLAMLKKLEMDLNKLKGSAMKSTKKVEYYLKERKNSINWMTKLAIFSTCLFFITIFGLYLYVRLGLIKLVQ
ncbi:hypothetical protein M153_1100070981 [Pseudoloma neurophilia]|uniref:Uncharacterized protein n=1 Tax=Pseudoloma neurophilia TaxID=146866 RepID=A0A0R0M110_9MICR|nr:hypothetical protein M153_1100070981 [Pseudoloma neurophilia]